MSNDTRNATQKIEDLEKVVTMLYQATAEIKQGLEYLMKSQGDMALVKDALKLLNKKTEAIIQTAAPETGITVDSVSALVVKMNVDDLTAQVAGFVKNGHLAPAEEVAENSYLVCEEATADGTVTNPRIQFPLNSQDAETKAVLLGKKAGDTAYFGENKLSAKILEVYSLVEPKAPEAATTPEAETAHVAAEAAATAAVVAETAAVSASNAASAAPEVPSVSETPVTEFVASDPSTMATA